MNKQKECCKQKNRQRKNISSIENVKRVCEKIEEYIIELEQND